MVQIDIRPATAERFDDTEHALTGGGDGRSCQCQWWTLTSADWQRSTAEERVELLRAETADALPPALVAYVDGEAAGWVRIGPRIRQPRIGRSRTLSPHATAPLDDADVWAVTCFVVRKEHRRKGLNARLLAAAVDFARDHGARVVEAYPTDTAAVSKPSNELFRGILSVFTAAGFSEIARPKPDLAIVALDLSS